MVKKFIKDRLGTIILFAIVLIFVLWGVLSINKARENAVTYVTDYVAPDATRDMKAEGSYVSVAKSGNLELFYNDKKGAIQVKNLETGYVWKSIVDDEVYDISSANKQWTNYMTSPITITYNDLRNKSAAVTKQYASVDCGYLETNNIENGIAVTYGFLKPGIYITIEYALDGGELVARITSGEIREESKYAVTTIELMPYFGAAGNEVSGYLFYPDGSGAITTYDNYKNRTSSVKAATFYGYTPRTFTEASLFNDEEYERYTAALPVYGIKNDDNAVLAAFTKGGENCGIVAYPSGYVIDLNHIGFEIYTRNIFNVNAFNMSTGTGTAATGSIIQRVDKVLIPEDREVRFFFLSGDDANYSGMARAYRDYLLETGELTDSLADGEEMPLALKLLMGASKDGMVFEQYIPMTTFDEAEEILERLREKGVTNSQVVLRSWTKKGEWTMNYWPAASKLGGSGGLKSINEYASKNTGTNIYLETQFTEVTNKTTGVNEDKDVAYDGLNTELATEYNKWAYYLLNFQAAYDRNEKLLSKTAKYDSLGIAYKWLGMYVYPDYNENASFTKNEAVEKLKSLLASTESHNRSIGVQGANQYTYAYADYLYDLREESYGLAVTDYGVPFVEMVLSGLKNYSTNGAGNLSYDLQYQKLKWAEYGAIPFFSLTYESALNLRETGYDMLFSSTYEDWEDVVTDTYNEYKNAFGAVYGQQMTGHEVLADNFVCVTYANGYKVYINYNDNEMKSGSVTVPAMDYVVVKGGE